MLRNALPLKCAGQTSMRMKGAGPSASAHQTTRLWPKLVNENTYKAEVGHRFDGWLRDNIFESLSCWPCLVLHAPIPFPSEDIVTFTKQKINTGRSPKQQAAKNKARLLFQCACHLYDPVRAFPFPSEKKSPKTLLGEFCSLPPKTRSLAADQT